MHVRKLQITLCTQGVEEEVQGRQRFLWLAFSTPIGRKSLSLQEVSSPALDQELSGGNGLFQTLTFTFSSLAEFTNY